MKIIHSYKRIIEYSFYAIFLFVPLFFLGNTSELFEFNKMWLTFALTIIIAVTWISKMITERKISIRRTPLDIPIFLFLFSQIISTIFSLDTHVSLWGYYSRFNGGLYSTISYIILYYAFISNLEIKHVFRVLTISLVSGIASAIWGFPSHFGYDPTCFVFRGVMDTNCWTDAFKPTIRIFSTLGQPAWFAAYIDILLPITMAYALIKAKKHKTKSFIFLLAILLLFYLCLIFSDTRAGSIAFYLIDIIFWAIIFLKKIFSTKIFLRYLLIIHIIFLVSNFFFGTTIAALDKYTYPELKKKIIAYAQTEKPAPQKPKAIKITGITDSAEIRLIVWKGAIEAWKLNPVFGTGVETFAYAYYKFRPAEHNMTSEWDYLYNKAHNEYLNYLTTTGLFGLGTYLAIIFIFIFIALKYIFSHKESSENLLYTLALLSSFLTILITNFFGFSVVIINVYFFLIPAFVLLITARLDPEKNYSFAFGNNSLHKKTPLSISIYQWILIIITIIIGANMLLGLFRYWYADTLYALGANLDHSSNFQQAYPLLQDAVTAEPDEPVYKDELAINLATIAQALYLQKNITLADQLAQKSINLSDQIVKDHPNNVVFWKNRLRIFYSLASGDSKNQEKYTAEALNALYKSAELAPTDAKITYNLGAFLGQTGNLKEATKILEKTISLKPDYVDAYYALGQFYHQLAIDQTASESSKETITNPEWQKKAIDIYQFVLDDLSPNNDQFKKALQSWKEQ